MSNLTASEVISHLIDRNADALGFDFDVFPLTKIQYPIISCTFYAISISYLSSKSPKVQDNKQRRKKKKESSLFQKVIIFIHNTLLCLFSVLCFTNTWPIIYSAWSEGIRTALCDSIYINNDTWWYWTYLFYLSKYYEFFDTYILVWKGKSISFLQKFHHIGAVFSMWIILASKSHTGYIFVIPNSFIHSIMYLYYSLSVWGIKVPFKYILTRMQMFQFCIGISLGLTEIYHWDCQTFPDQLSIVFNSVYVPILLLLFLNFYIQTYLEKKKKNR